MSLAPGALVDGRYELETLAGEGASGAVYRARDRETERTVALKVLHGDQSGGLARFELEAELLSKIDHPVLAGYFGHGVSNEGHRFLAMEWLEGETLAERLRRGALDVADAVTLGRRVAEALGAAHSLGAVHRDLKPANLFLRGGSIEDVRLLDFGVALWSGAKLTTEDGPVVGTPGYMAPEQARAETSVDARADVFALGCVLFEALTGRAAFRGPHAMAVLAKVVFDVVPPVTTLRDDVPQELSELVSAMLHKDPAQRPKDGATVAGILANPDTLEAARASSPTLLTREQRLVSVFVATARERVDLSELRTEGAAEGLDLAQLADGSVIGTLRPSGAATDLAALAAARATQLADRLGRARVALCIGRAELSSGAPVGEVIDRASMLLRADRVGGVVVDETTRGLLAQRWELDGNLLVGPLASDDGRQLLGKRTPLVGRDRELAVLEELFDEAEEEETSVVALVTGGPGAGKTRLRRELVERLRERDEAPRIDIARGEVVGAGSSLELVRRLLRGAMGARGAVTDAEGRARLAEHVDRGRTFDFLSEILGWSPPEGEVPEHLLAARRDRVLMHDQQRAAWTAWLRARSADRPLVIVLEDLQWGDAPSLRLLDSALSVLDDAPVFLLAFARDELAERFGRPFEAHSPVELSLGPLSRTACERLVRAVLDPVDEGTVAALVERAEGNAFYLEELIRSVAEGSSRDAFPDSIVAMAQARLERLEPEDRQLLRAASVLGRAFWPGALCALLGASAADLDARLDSLVSSELVRTRRLSRVTGQRELVFRHDLVQQASYATLGPDDRRTAHEGAARWLEEHGLDDPVVLATHHERAGDGARAATHWLAAAARALFSNDFEAALDRARRVASSTPDDETRGRALCIEAEAHRWRGEHKLAATRSERAAGLLERGRAPWFDAVRETLMAHGRAGAYEEVLRFARLALDVQATDEHGRIARVLLLVGAGRQLFHAGRYDLADDAIEEALRLAPDPDALEASIAAQIHGLRAAAARHRGDLLGDLNGYRRTLDAFERGADERNACNCRVSVAFAHAELGEWERAQAELEQALADAERLDIAGIATRARQNLGLVLCARGDYERAATLLDRVIGESRAQGNARFEGWTAIYRAQVAFASGDLDRAVRVGTRAADLLAVSRPAQAGAHAIMARALVRQGQVSEARVLAAEAMRVLEELGGIEEFESLVQLARAEVALADGDVGQIARARARLLERAEGLEGAHREGFLSRVPENAETIRLAEEHS